MCDTPRVDYYSREGLTEMGGFGTWTDPDSCARYHKITTEISVSSSCCEGIGPEHPSYSFYTFAATLVREWRPGSPWSDVFSGGGAMSSGRWVAATGEWEECAYPTPTYDGGYYFQPDDGWLRAWGCGDGEAAHIDCGGPCYPSPTVTTTDEVITWTYPDGFGTVIFTLSELQTPLTLAVAAAGDMDEGYEPDEEQRGAEFIPFYIDECLHSVFVREVQYEIRRGTAGLGPRMLLTWVERLLPLGGAVVDDITVFAPGDVRPSAVAVGGGGAGCLLICDLNAAGQVVAIRVMAPGSGYTSAPAVVVQAAINGGTTATGWTATLDGDGVGGVAGGSGGDYLPTYTLHAETPGTLDVTVALTATGGVATVGVVDSSVFPEEPILLMVPKIAGAIAPDLLIHMGTEVPREASADVNESGTVILTGFELRGLEIPVAPGRRYVANLRQLCL